jgi:hypothetical protein
MLELLMMLLLLLLLVMVMQLFSAVIFRASVTFLIVICRTSQKTHRH